MGFVMGAGFSLAGHAPLAVVLFRACVGAVVLALLARWWSSRWVLSLQEALEQQVQSSVARRDKTEGKV